MADELFANGIMADTGEPLPLPGEEAGKCIAESAAAAEEEKSIQTRATQAQTFGVSADVDPDDLSQTGWGIVFPADTDTTEIEQALAPLIERRRDQATQVDNLFKIFKGSAGWRPGESATDWLARQGQHGPGPGLDVVNPNAGVPYYLMIVGSPDALPMSFQYTLDIFWAAGRLHFPATAEYARYAKSVVDYEIADKPPQSHKQAALFATEHDAATTMFTNLVARPFLNGDSLQRPLGKNQRFNVDPILGSEATRDAFASLLRGKRPSGLPAMLFSGSHGMAFRPEDKRQKDCQGALLCQDCTEFGQTDERAWFSAANIPADASIHGMIYFMFACYGGGWEKFDTFRTGPNGTARQIAPAASVSRLPQAMLAHPNGGMLAVLAHVDRAFSYSFKTVQGGSQSTGMRDVLTGIMMGRRLGHAVDQFNVRWAAVSTQIADALRDFKDGKISGTDLATQWIVRDDARNYSILGDPAVKLRVEDMVDGPSKQ